MPLLPKETPMSDEPLDAQKLIAEVLKPLIYADMRYPDELFAQRRAEAYAAEVDKALGGLTPLDRYRAVGPGARMPCWDREYAAQALKWFPDDYTTVESQRRFVSGWTVSE